MKRRVIFTSLFLFLFVLFLVFSFIFEPVLFWPLLENKVTSSVSLNGVDSEAWKTWNTTDFKDAPILYETYTLYNYTNHEEVLQGKAPIVKEIGPFVYRVHKNRFDVTFHDGNEKVRYKEWTFFTFERNLSIGDPHDYDIVLPSAPYLGLLHKIKLELMLTTAYTPAVLTETMDHMKNQFKSDLMAFVSSDYIFKASEQLIKEEIDKSNVTYDEAQLWFFSHFANETKETNNQLLNGMMISNGNKASLLSVNTCELLFSEDEEDSLVYVTQNFTHNSIARWIHAPYDSDLSQHLMVKFNISKQQLQMVSSWLVSKHFHKFVVVPYILDQFGIISMDDLDCHQWAESKFIDESFSTLYPTQFSHGHPEFYQWAKENDYDSNFMTMNNCKLLFRDRTNLRAITHTETYMAFNALLLNAIVTQNYSIVEANWNVTSLWQAKALLDYFSYLKNGYSEARVNYWLKHGSGLFPRRTAHEWLWNYTDPIISRLSENTRNPNFKQNKTSEQHARETTKFNTMYTGVNNISRIFKYAEFQELEEIDWMYPKPMSIYGSSESGQFKPLLPRNFEPIQVFQDEYMKILDLVKMCEDKVKKIKNDIYSSHNHTWKKDISMNNFIEGFWNVSAKFNNSPILLGMPHFRGVGSFYKDKIKGDIHNQNDSIDITRVYIEPWSGRVMKLAKSIQINLWVSNETSWFFLSPYHPNMATDIVLPMIWVKQNMEMTDALVPKLEKIQKALNLRVFIKFACFGLAGVLGIVFVILLVTTIRKYRNSDDYPFERINL